MVYDWSEDKIKNEWPSIIYDSLVRKQVKPGGLRLDAKIELMCEKHGIFARRIRSLYETLNNSDRLGCPECSKVLAINKRKETNNGRYGADFPLQNKEIMSKRKETNNCYRIIHK
jgi:hypothetical protein